MRVCGTFYFTGDFMAQYDGSIRINTQISTGMAEKSLGMLSSTITKTAKEISSLRSKMDALRGQKFYTDDYKKLQSDLANAEKKLSEFTSLAKDSGKLTEGQQNQINKKIREYGDEIDSIKGKMKSLEDSGKAFTLGENTKEYANLERQKQAEEEALRLATKHYQQVEKLNDPYGRLSQALKDLISKLSVIARMSQMIKQSFSSSDVNVSGYERLNSALGELKGTAGKVFEFMKQSFLDIRENGIWAIADMTNRMSTALVSRLGDSLDGASEKIGEILMKPVAASYKAGTSIKYALGSAVDSVKEKVAGFAGGAINGMLHPFQTLKNVASSAVGGTANMLKSVLAPVMDSIKARAAGMAASIMNGIAHPFQTMKSIASKAISGTSKLLSGLVSITKKAGTAIKSMASSFLRIGKSAKSASGGLSSMGYSLKTMLKNALGISSIYMLFSKLHSAIKEGFGNLAQYSAPVNTALSSLKSSLTQLKNSLATAFAPILTAIAPALTTLINMVSKAATAVGMLIAALTGQKTFTKAKGVQEDYAASLGKTAKKAKEANKQLSSLDKLNNLTTNDPGDDDGVGGGGAGIGDMFETVDIPSKIKDLADMLKKAWEDADFTEIGVLIGEKLKEALESIPWDKIQAVAEKLGKSLATLINGFVSVVGLGQTIGNTLAQAINTGFMFMNAFVHNLDWASVGKFIANMVNGFFTGINWGLIYDTFVTGAKGLGNAINSFADNLNWEAISSTVSNVVNTFVNTIYTFFDTVEWAKIGRKVGGFISDSLAGINWGKLGETIGKGFQSVFTFLLVSIENIDWGKVGTYIANALNGVVSSLNLTTVGELLGKSFTGLFDLAIGFAKDFDWIKLGDNIANGINGFFADFDGAKFGQAATGLISGLLDTIITTISETDWTAVGRDIVDFIVNVNWLELAGKFVIAAGQLIFGLVKGLVQAIAETDWGKVWDSIVQAFKDFFGIHSPSTLMEGMGTYLMEGLINGISSLVGDVVSIFGDIKEKVSGKWQEIKQDTESKWGDIKTKLSETWESIETKTSTAVQNIQTKMETGFGSALTTVRSKLDAILSKIRSVMDDVKEKVGGVIESIKNFFKFEWSLPPLKLPHFSISGSFSLNPPSVPSFSVNWYKKGGIFDKASLIGVGEAGPEAVLPLNSKSFSAIAQGIVDKLETSPLSIQAPTPPIPNIASGRVIPIGMSKAILGNSAKASENNIGVPVSDVKEMIKAMSSNNSDREINLNLTVECDGFKLLQLIQKLDLEHYNRTGRPSFQI